MTTPHLIVLMIVNSVLACLGATVLLGGRKR
jgi:hypothetical protein